MMIYVIAIFMLVASCSAIAQVADPFSESDGAFTSFANSTNTPSYKPDLWTNNGAFHQLIAKADRIVIRNGGHDCCDANVDEQKTLISITNRSEITQFNSNIQFESPQEVGWSCLCCGFPGLDWFKGTNRIALTSVQHGQALRWKQFPADISLTKHSSEWFIDWLLDHNIKGMFKEYEKLKRERNSQQEVPELRR